MDESESERKYLRWSVVCCGRESEMGDGRKRAGRGDNGLGEQEFEGAEEGEDVASCGR